MWKRKLEAEAVEAVNFLWKQKHFDERGWKRKRTRKRKCSKGAGSGSNFFKIRRFRIFNLATTVGVKCYNNNNNIESTTPASWSSGNAFVSGAGGLRFKSRAGQIGRSVANGSPSLRHFFERSCVARAQWRGDGPRQLVTRFGVIQRV